VAEAGADGEEGRMRRVHPADVCSVEDEREGRPWPLLSRRNAEEPWKEEKGRK